MSSAQYYSQALRGVIVGHPLAHVQAQQDFLDPFFLVLFPLWIFLLIFFLWVLEPKKE